MLIKKGFLLILLHVLFVSQSLALGEEVYLAQMLSQMKQQYQALKDQLQEAEFISEQAKLMRETADNILAQWDYVQQFSLEEELKAVISEMDGLMRLKKIAKTDDRKKQLDMLLLEIDRHLASQSKATLQERLTEYFDELEVSIEREMALRLEALEASGGYKAFKDHLAAINVATASLAVEAEERRQQTLELLIYHTEQVIGIVDYDQHFLNYLKGDY